MYKEAGATPYRAAANHTPLPSENTYAAIPAGVLMLNDAELILECNPIAESLLGGGLCGAHWPTVAARNFTFGGADCGELALCGERLLNIISANSPDGGKILLLVDVTENRALQKRFFEQQRLSALSDLATELAHQIRTPLAMSTLYVSQLAQGNLPERSRKDFADKVNGGLRHVQKLVEDILLSDKDPIPENEEISVSALLAECARIHAAELAAAGCELSIVDGAPNAVVRGTPAGLSRVLCNLVRNAIQACGPGGKLELSTQVSGGDELALKIKDTGPGISDELRQIIFEPFVSTRPDALGLGLTVARAIVRAHHGVLWLDSGPDTGACFVVQLPAEIPPNSCVIDFFEAAKRARHN
jgi:two-component system sensor histidine kinase FlrB